MVLERENRFMGLFHRHFSQKWSFLRPKVVILGGSNGIFWVSKLELIVLTRFDTWYVVGTLLCHIPDHQKLYFMGF